MKKRFLIWLCSISVLLSGCGAAGAGNEPQTDVPQPGGRAEAESVSGEDLPALPWICVNRMGYEPDQEKLAIFRGESLPDTFVLRDAETRQVVYTGVVENKGNDDAGTEYNGYGDFSEYRIPGNYYIQTDRLGESYPFLIHDNLEYSLFLRAAGRLYAMRGLGASGGWEIRATGEDKVMDACRSVYRLLLSYEMFPEVYTDDTGIPESGNETADILDECRYEANWLIGQAEAEGNSGRVCAYLAATLAKYAYQIRGTDTEFAGDCLQAAETAWKCAEKDLFVSDDLIALAAAELYRLTGSGQYLGLAEEYLENSTKKTGGLSDAEFFGSITYMNTRNDVDIELCNAMMKKIMEEAEEMARTSKENGFLVCDEGEEGSLDTILGQTVRICVVNHIITNHEYSTVIENQFHYLMGRNPDSICHVSWQDGQEQAGDVMEDTVQISALLFILSERLSNNP